MQASMEPVRSQKLAPRLALLLLGTLFGLACLEAYARIVLSRSHVTTGGVWPGFDGRMARGLFEPDDEIGFVPGPAWRGRDGRYGFQNGAEYPAKRAGDVDWALLGDSVLLHRRLEAALEERLAGEPIRIYNAGIGGYNTLQQAAYLEKHVSLEPDVLILQYCLNDYLPGMVIVASDRWEKGSFAMSRLDPLAAVHPWWYRHSALYRHIQILGISRRYENLFSPEGVTAHRHLVEAGLDRIQAWSRRRRVPLYVIVYPHLDIPEKAWQTTAMTQVTSVLESRGISYVGLHEPMRRHGLEKLRSDPADTVHPNLDGHRIAADVFLRAFADELGLDPPSL